MTAKSKEAEASLNSLQKNAAVTVISSVERLLQDDISAPGENAAQLFCAKNETEAFQIIVTNRSTEALPDVEIYVSDWQGPAGTKKPKITLFREHYIKITTPSYGLPADTPVGWYPDALIPFVDPYTGRKITTGLYRADHVSVAGKKNQGYWVDVRVDADVPAGTYTCSILVTSSDRPIAEIPVTLIVWNLTLPRQRQFITWYYKFHEIHQYYGLSNASGPSYSTLIERHQDMAYEHGVYPVPQYVGSNGKRDSNTGVVTFSDSYISGMKSFVAKYGTGIVQIPPSYYQSDPEKFVLYDEAKFKNTVRSYDKLSKTHPEFGQFVIYFDEPDKPERVAAVMKAKTWMNDIPATRIKMMLTGAKYAYDILDSQGNRCPDLWIAYGSPVIRDGLKDGYTLEELVEKCLKENKVVWTNNPNHFTDSPFSGYRNWAWYGYTIGMTGGFGWRLTMPSTYKIDAWTDAVTWTSDGFTFNGNGIHVYPGNTERIGISNGGGPIASMRLKLWRKAVEDYELFKLCEGVAGKAAVDAIVSGVVQSYETYPNQASYEGARLTLAGLLLERQ